MMEPDREKNAKTRAFQDGRIGSPALGWGQELMM